MRMLIVLALALGLLIAISGGLLAKMGEWRAFSYDNAALEGKPQGLHFYSDIMLSGEYYVFYGSAGFFGDQLPPKEIRRAGPFKVELGENYVCIFGKAGVQWSKLPSESFKSYEGKSMIYLRDERGSLDRLFLGVMITEDSKLK